MKRLILVMGCHRSGTSAVAGLLPSLGVEMGNRLLGPAPDNPLGFFEDIDVLELNDRLLMKMGSSWRGSSPLNWSVTTKLWFKDEQNYATGLLYRKMKNCEIFGLKDPRFCRLAPFWNGVFSGLKLDVSIVHVVRHPAEVIASLKARDEMDEAEAENLWLAYENDFRYWSNPRTVHVSYNSLLGQPVVHAIRLRDMLGLTSDKLCSNIPIQSQLRHHRRSDIVSTPAENLWAALEELCV